MKRLLTALCLLCLFVPTIRAEEGFTSMMTVKNGNAWTENGVPLNGWVKYGGDATFLVEGAEIVGSRGPGPNTFLCTEKSYENFVVKFEFKFDVNCNSGVQFRSELRPSGKDDKNGTVFGYQCEMDQGGDTGNVYDESRRNRWIEPFTPEMRENIKKAYKAGDWNEMTIQCVGPSVKTWLNGEKVADFFDILSSDGFFGLQVHGGDQGKVRWRNIRIQELPSTPWVALYTDKTFGPVEKKPVGTWEIQDDGSLKGTTESGQPKDGMILSKESYKDFAVKVSFKKIAGNSGLYFRAAEVDKPYWLKGFQCEIEAGGVCSGLWEVEGRGWVAKNEEVAAKVYKVEDWNDVGTVAVGDHLVTWLNGQKIVDIVDPDCAKEGKTGLQLHGGGNQGYLFREYHIMPLDAKAVERIAK